MIPPANINNLPTLTGGAAAAPTVASSLDSATIATALTQNSQNILAQVAVGGLVQAQVLAQLEDGSYIVGVGDSALHMSLPEGTAVGNQLEMTYMGDSPRPTFLLESQTDNNAASLSSAGKIISNVLQTADEANAPTVLTAKTPILPEPATDSQHIANAMQDSVEFSGLFYEAHVSQWASGERPLADLMREPQMQQAPELGLGLDLDLDPGAERSAGSAASAQSAATRTQDTQPAATGSMLQRPATSETALAALVNNARAGTDTRSSLGQTLTTLLNSARGLPQEADTMIKPATITPENSQTIHLQLTTLEQNRLVWQGELWPGQNMEWEIQEEENQHSQSGQADADQSSWNSTVRFELPKLGRISATIHLSGGHVQMRLAAATSETAGMLRSHGKSLAEALDDAGSPLDSLSIGQDEQA